jgi:hypothetical protein
MNRYGRWFRCPPHLEESWWTNSFGTQQMSSDIATSTKDVAETAKSDETDGRVLLGCVTVTPPPRQMAAPLAVTPAVSSDLT